MKNLFHSQSHLRILFFLFLQKTQSLPHFNFEVNLSFVFVKIIKVYLQYMKLNTSIKLKIQVPEIDCSRNIELIFELFIIKFVGENKIKEH